MFTNIGTPHGESHIRVRQVWSDLVCCLHQALGWTECFIHGAPLPMSPCHDTTDSQSFDEIYPVIIMACLLPGNSILENVAVNQKNIQTVLNKSHIPAAHMSDMHWVGSSQRIALITYTHVLIVLLTESWETFCCALCYTLPPEYCCWNSLVTWSDEQAPEINIIPPT